MVTLGDIPNELARWYGRRLKYLWITSVSEGLGFFVVYTVLIFAAALQAYSCLSLRWKDEARLDEFLQSDHQVHDEDRYASVLSVVLAALRSPQRITQGACPPDSLECARARNLVNTTVRIAQLIASRAMREPATVETTGTGASESAKFTDIADLEAILGSNHMPPAAAPSVRVAVEKGVATLKMNSGLPSGQILVTLPEEARKRLLLTNTTSTMLRPAPTTSQESDPAGLQLARCEATTGSPGAADEENRRRMQFDLFEARCERAETDVSGLQIPEQTAGLESPTPTEHSQVIARLQRAIGISYALEAALRAAVTQPRSEPAGETRTLTAAYFVSVDSVLRYWRDETIDPVKRLPKNIRWASREYFKTYEQGATALGDEYVSEPYIDIAGAGIVETICRAMTAPPPKAQDKETLLRVKTRPDKMTADGKETRVAGIVCADLALRPQAVKSLVSYIQDGPLVTAGLVRIQSNGETEVEPTSSSDHTPYLQELISSAQWKSTFTTGWTTGLATRGPTRLIDDSRVWYVFPIAKSGTGLLAIALHPAPSSGVGHLFRWAWLGGICGAALVLLTFTANQSRRVAIGGRDLARLRGLTMAVLEVRVDPEAPEDYARQVIVAGNDRAEEVLQVPLPNFGLTDGAKPVLGTIFDERMLVLAKQDGMTPEEVLTNAKEISEARKRGDASTYFARMRRARTVWQFPTAGQREKKAEYSWVKVAGGAVILPHRRRGVSQDARGRLESIVGIIAPVTDKGLGDRLDAIVAKHLPQT